MAKQGTAGTTEQASQRVYETIRARILDGTFKSGDHLVEVEMARLTNSSRTPVREALRQLAGEGLLTIGPTRRMRVADFGNEEIHAIYEIRARLEGYACGLAARNRNDAHVQALRTLNARIAKLTSLDTSGALVQFYSLNLDFHRRILDMAASKQLELALGTALATPLALLKHHITGDQVQIALSCQQHDEIILAIESGNEKWASACMVAHIETSRPVGARDLPRVFLSK